MKTEVLDAGSITGYDEEVDVLVVGLGCAGAATALADHAAAAEGDDARIDELTAAVPEATVARVPLLPSDVHDVETLQRIAELLTDDR